MNGPNLTDNLSFLNYSPNSFSLLGTPPFWHHRQLNMIRLIMRGQYSMEGPAWTNVTSETKDLIKRLLVVNPNERLTIEQALDHEVFHAQRFTRVDGELLCIVQQLDKIIQSIAQKCINYDRNKCFICKQFEYFGFMCLLPGTC